MKAACQHATARKYAANHRVVKSLPLTLIKVINIDNFAIILVDYCYLAIEAN
jgi:hypothetical protein